MAMNQITQSGERENCCHAREISRLIGAIEVERAWFPPRLFQGGLIKVELACVGKKMHDKRDDET